MVPHHRDGWDGAAAAAHQVNLGTVTDPHTGAEPNSTSESESGSATEVSDTVVFFKLPKRLVCTLGRSTNHRDQHAASAARGRLYELLREYEERYFQTPTRQRSDSSDTNAPWHRLTFFLGKHF